MENDDSVTEAFVLGMRFECLKLASNPNLGNEDAASIVKAATILFKFLIDDIPEDEEEEEERTN